MPRWARDIWVGVIRQLEESGLTHEQFADERNIPVSTLRYWIYRLRREAPESPSLLPVRVIASTAPSARQSFDELPAIEAVLPDGLRVRFAAGTDAEMVAQLLERLRRC